MPITLDPTTIYISVTVLKDQVEGYQNPWFLLPCKPGYTDFWKMTAHFDTYKLWILFFLVPGTPESSCGIQGDRINGFPDNNWYLDLFDTERYTHSRENSRCKDSSWQTLGRFSQRWKTFSENEVQFAYAYPLEIILCPCDPSTRKKLTSARR